MKKLIALLFCLMLATPATPQQSVTLFYVATAVDNNGLESAFSNESAATVSGLHNVVDLSWTASTSIVAGYNMYRGKVSGGPYTKINTSLIAGTTYTDTITFPASPTALKNTVP